MEVHLVVRKTLDWDDPERVEAGLLPGFRSKYECWNATFEMPYAAFRARLKAIASANLARVEGARVSAPEVVPQEGMVVGIDDDDWLAPQLATEIRRALARHPGPPPVGVHWVREVVSPPRRRRRLRRWLRPTRARGRHTCATNDYAVRADLPEAEKVAKSHLTASDFFDAHRDRVLWIHRILAIQNRNLASRTALRWREPSIDRDFLLARYESYRRFYAGWRIRRELRWAQPCIDAMAALMEELRPRGA